MSDIPKFKPGAYIILFIMLSLFTLFGFVAFYPVDFYYIKSNYHFSIQLLFSSKICLMLKFFFASIITVHLVEMIIMLSIFRSKKISKGDWIDILLWSLLTLCLGGYTMNFFSMEQVNESKIKSNSNKSNNVTIEKTNKRQKKLRKGD